MFPEIRTLLQDPALRNSLKAAKSPDDAQRIITSAANARGIVLSPAVTSQLAAEWVANNGELSDADLVAIVGGLKIRTER